MIKNKIILISIFSFFSLLFIKSIPMKYPIYLDNQATTPMDPRVIKKINYVSKKYFGNPNSLHKVGQDAKKIVDESRLNVSRIINANPKEIIFTSGATESNNLIIKGILYKYRNQKRKKHIISTSIEHACVKNTLAKMEEEGFEVTYLMPQKNGIINLNELKNAIKKNTILISIIGVNNEIGVIQDLNKIGEISKKHNILFHTDCAQAFGKVKLDVESMNIDFMSISGHKIYGPKGIGALYIKEKNKKLISPLIDGGGQEEGIRSGTIPVQIISGLGEAAKIASKEMTSDGKRIERLSNKLKKGILQIEGAVLNGDPEKRYKGCMNFSFRGIKGREITDRLSNKLALSIGSACGSSKEAVDSYVIKSLGLDYDLTGGVRFGIGKFTTDKEIEYTVKIIKKTVNEIRKEK